MPDKIDLIKELRLLICGWCFCLSFWLAPKDDVEGQLIVESIHQWAAKVQLFRKYNS